jgi:hypothetical protein
MSYAARALHGFQHAAERSASEATSERAAGAELEASTTTGLDGPARDGAIDARQRVGHPAAESAFGRQEPASIEILAAGATSQVVELEREATARVYAHAGRRDALADRIDELERGGSACEARHAVIAAARASIWGRLHLLWLALVVGGVGALEVTMNDLALRWLSLPEQEYRLVAVVVSLALELGAVAFAVRLRDPERETSQAALWLRVLLGAIVGTLTFTVGLLRGVPGLVEARGPEPPPVSALVGLACGAILVGLVVVAIRRWSLLALAGAGLLGGGLVALTALRTDPHLMTGAKGGELAFGTIALGAAAIAATCFVFVVTETLLARHAENAVAERAACIRDELDTWHDLAHLARVVEASFVATVDELRHDGQGRIRAVEERFQRDAHSYAQGAQRAHAEAAPDVTRQVARCAAAIAKAAAAATHTIDRVADWAIASSTTTTRKGDAR